MADDDEPLSPEDQEFWGNAHRLYATKEEVKARKERWQRVLAGEDADPPTTSDPELPRREPGATRSA